MKRKFHVSLEAARLMKEKGYNEETIYYYNSAGKLYLGNGHFNYNAYAVNLSAPSKSEAIDWLESKGMLIEITIDIDECAWIFNIVDKEKFITIGHPKDGEFFTDRLEAEEAAIIKALELL